MDWKLFSFDSQKNKQTFNSNMYQKSTLSRWGKNKQSIQLLANVNGRTALLHEDYLRVFVCLFVF